MVDRLGRRAPGPFAEAITVDPCPHAASHRPWIIDEHNDACFIVKDATGQALGYFYFEDEPGRRSAAKLLTGDETRNVRRQRE